MKTRAQAAHAAGQLWCRAAFGALVLAWASRSAPAALPLIITSGQQFADAVASNAAGNQDMDVRLGTPYVTVRNATFSSAPPDSPPIPPSNTLSIQPADISNTVVFDLGMRAELTTPFFGPGKTNLTNLVIINTCEIIVRKQAGPSGFTSNHCALFALARQEQRQTYRDVVLYTRLAGLKTTLYAGLVQVVAFQQILNMTSWILFEQSQTTSVAGKITPYTLQILRLELGYLRVFNLTVKATNNPDDPLLNSLKASNLLMPPTFCANGSLLPEPLANADIPPYQGPLWIASNRAELALALNKAANHSINSSPDPQFGQWAPPFVNVVESTSLDLLSNPVTVGHMVLIIGPRIDIPEITPPATLDLARQTGAIVLLPGAQLFIQALFVASTTPDAATYSASAPFLWLHNITLVIPTADYLAFLSLALSSSSATAATGSCLAGDPTTQRLVSQLQPHITVLRVESWDSGHQWVALAQLTGWGMNATRVRLAPEVPVAYEVLLRCAPSQEHGSHQHWHYITMGVLSGVAALALAAVAVLACKLHASKGGRCCWWQRQPSDDGQGGLLPSVQGLKALVPQPHASLQCNTNPTPLDESSASQTPHAADNAPVLPVADLVHSAEEIVAAHLGLPSLHVASTWPAVRLTVVPTAEVSKVNPTPLAQVAQTNSALNRVEPPVTSHVSPAQLVDGGRTSSSTNGGQRTVRQVPSESGPDATQREGPAEQTCSTGSVRMTPTASNDVEGTLLSTSSQRGSQGSPDHPRLAVEEKAAQLGRMGSNADKVAIKYILGMGSWGTVYAGLWRDLPVAIKTMVFSSHDRELFQLCGLDVPQQASGPGQDPQHPDDTQVVPSKRTSRAIMEAAIAASVGHKNLVATYHYDFVRLGTANEDEGTGGLKIVEDLSQAEEASLLNRAARSGPPRSEGQQDYKMYLIQELCGTTVERAVADRAFILADRVSTDQWVVFTILLDMASGLEYLHEKGIIHGDLKPANVLLKLDYKARVGVVAKLADFGLSTHISPMATHVSNFTAGSPFYVAPEVVSHHRVSTASDVFSFGVCAWQMYTGFPPYVIAPSGAMCYSPNYPHFVANNLPPEIFRCLVLQCLRVDPHARPSARTITQVLQQLLSHFPRV